MRPLREKYLFREITGPGVTKSGWLVVECVGCDRGTLTSGPILTTGTCHVTPNSGTQGPHSRGCGQWLLARGNDHGAFFACLITKKATSIAPLGSKAAVYVHMTHEEKNNCMALTSWEEQQTTQKM